jgi:PAS domain S-box-containing protein
MMWYFIVLILSVVVMTTLTIYAWYNRIVRKAGFFAWLLTSISGWLWFQLVMQISPSVEVASFFHKVYFTFIVTTALTWFMFASAYTGQKWLMSRTLVLLSIIPFISTVLIWTDGIHHLFIRHLDFHRSGFLLFPERVYGTWFYWVHTPYSYAIIVTGVVLLLFQTVRSSRLYRLQAIAMIIGALAPLISNAVATFGWVQFPTTFVGFAISGLLWSLAIFHYRFLDLVPVARNTLVDSMGDGMFVIDAQHRIVDLNPAAAQVIGCSMMDAVGQSVDRLFANQPELAAHYRGEPERHEEITVGKEAEECTYDLQISQLRDQRERPTGNLVILHDISERKRAERMLQCYSRELEASNADLNAFAHTVAHSLRSPLFALGKLARSLESDLGRIPIEEIGQDLRAIVQGSAQMENIIQELLLLASVHKQQQIEIHELDMAALVERALERLAYEIEACRAKVVLADDWPAALGYGPWIVEVWVNYISNALKYGGRPPRVELGATTQPGNGQVRFWVTDNGPGIESDKVARLFTQFERLGQTRVEGYGLGLPIVQHIVEKLNGRVDVESELGKGSTFWFTLPSCPIERYQSRGDDG